MVILIVIINFNKSFKCRHLCIVLCGYSRYYYLAAIYDEMKQGTISLLFIGNHPPVIG